MRCKVALEKFAGEYYSKIGLEKETNEYVRKICPGSPSTRSLGNIQFLFKRALLCPPHACLFNKAERWPRGKKRKRKKELGKNPFLPLSLCLKS
jgi:hypothetical protein